MKQEWDRYSKAVWEIELPHEEKLVMLALAQHACAHCGLAWPGVPKMRAMTGMGLNKLRAVLGRLVGRDRALLRVHAYGRGGRACSTAYVLLEGRLAAGHAPCDKCAANLAHPGRAGYLRKPEAAETQPPVGGYPPGKPNPRSVGIEPGSPPARPDTHRAGDPGEHPEAPGTRDVAATQRASRKTHLPALGLVTAQVAVAAALAGAPAARGGEQPSVEHEPSRACAREKQADAPAAQRSIPPSPDRSVGDELKALGIPAAAHLFGIPFGAATAADREEAQGQCQPEALALAPAREVR